MSWRLMDWAVDASEAAGVSLSARFLLVIMARYARDDEQRVWASQRTLAGELSLQDRQVRNLLEELREAGLIERAKVDPGRPVTWHLNRAHPGNQLPGSPVAQPAQPRQSVTGVAGVETPVTDYRTPRQSVTGPPRQSVTTKKGKGEKGKREGGARFASAGSAAASRVSFADAHSTARAEPEGVSKEGDECQARGDIHRPRSQPENLTTARVKPCGEESEKNQTARLNPSETRESSARGENPTPPFPPLPAERPEAGAAPEPTEAGMRERMAVIASPLPGFTPAPKRANRSADVQTVFDAWVAARTECAGRHGRKVGTVRLDAKRRKLIETALRDYSLDEVVAAVRGWLKSDFHTGGNDRRKVYDDLSLLLRDAAHVERFRDLDRDDGKVVRPSRWQGWEGEGPIRSTSQIGLS